MLLNNKGNKVCPNFRADTVSSLYKSHSICKMYV